MHCPTPSFRRSTLRRSILTYLAGGVVIVEKVFGFPGFGSLMIDAIRFRDVPLIEITVLIASCVYMLANLLADVVALLLNPRLRQAKSMTSWCRPLSSSSHASQLSGDRLPLSFKVGLTQFSRRTSSSLPRSLSRALRVAPRSARGRRSPA